MTVAGEGSPCVFASILLPTLPGRERQGGHPAHQFPCLNHCKDLQRALAAYIQRHPESQAETW